MRSFYVFITSLLLSQSFCQNVDEVPLKNNLMSNYLNKILDGLFEKISEKTFLIPLINLDDVGNFSNVEGKILGGLSKDVDGYKSYGFKLNTTVRSIEVKGKYDIQHLDIPGLFPVYGKGNFRITVELVNLNMLLDAVYNIREERFHIKLPTFKILVENSAVKFENLMNDPHLADFLNELISNLIPDLITMLTAPLLMLLNPLIDFYGNGILNCVKTQPFNIDECIKDLFKEMAIDETLSSKLGIALEKVIVDLSRLF